MRIKSFSKINLTLRVLKKLKNGMHDIETSSVLTNLYDEIRHLLFLIPIIFIISFSFLYSISKKIFQSIIAIFIFFFIFQNIKIFPYNYLWLNNFSSFTNINSSFEKDYWGLSTRRISNFFNENSLGNECIISNRNKSIEAFVENKNACFLNFRKLHQNNKRPFYVVLVEQQMQLWVYFSILKTRKLTFFTLKNFGYI